MPVEATLETLVAVSQPATGRALDTLAAAEARAQRTPLEAAGRSSGFGLDSGLEGWQKWQSQAFRSYAQAGRTGAALYERARHAKPACRSSHGVENLGNHLRGGCRIEEAHASHRLAEPNRGSDEGYLVLE